MTQKKAVSCYKKLNQLFNNEINKITFFKYNFMKEDLEPSIITKIDTYLSELERLYTIAFPKENFF